MAGSGTIYAGGDFSSIGNAPRSCLAAVDTASGAATSWNPGANNSVYSLLLSADQNTLFAGGAFSAIGGQARNNLSAFDATNPDATAGLLAYSQRAREGLVSSNSDGMMRGGPDHRRAGWVGVALFNICVPLCGSSSVGL